MSKTLKEVTVIVGQYTNAAGETKNRYQRIGSIIETRNGEMLKLDQIPLREGGWDGWARLYEPKPKTEITKHPAPEYAPHDDDVPF